MSLIVGRAPLRLPLAGGLSDIPEFVAMEPGRTVSVAISLQVYAQVKRNPAGSSGLHLNRGTLRGSSLRAIPNELLASVLQALDADLTATDVYLMSDMPGSSGLGGSGAATVALTAALTRALGHDETPATILERAAAAEVHIAHNGGYHDSAIATLGGLQHLTYGPAGLTDHRRLSDGAARHLLDGARLRLLPTAHSTAASLRDLRARIVEIRPLLSEMAEIADELEAAFASDDAFGPRHLALIRRSQNLKARVLGGAYSDAADRASRLHDSPTTVAILPGGKLGSTLWVLRTGSGPPRAGDDGWADLTVGLAGGVEIQEFT